jgi:hypothetical protein
MNGTTVGQFQDSFKIQHTGACTASGCTGWVQEFARTLPPTALPIPITSSTTTPGAWGAWPVIRGPISWTSDMSATKRVTLHEKYRFFLQATASNVFNHPNIGLGSLSLASTQFRTCHPERQPQHGASREYRVLTAPAPSGSDRTRAVQP